MKYTVKDFEKGEKVKVSYEILSKVSKEVEGKIVGIDTKRIKSGILKIDEGKLIREVAIMYIKNVERLVRKVKRVDKYKQLTEDLIEAKEKAIEEAAKVDDGGTANLDSAFLVLKSWREEKVLEAIKEAGLYCREKSKWIGTGYFIAPVGGDGYKRTKGRNAFIECMREKGYSVLGFDKVD